MLHPKDIIEILKRITLRINEEKEYLTKLDEKTGDGEHGTNMNKGFSEVYLKLPEIVGMNIEEILKNVAFVLMKKSGGASGLLYGSAFLRMSQSSSDKKSLDKNDVLVLYKSALNEISKRGKSKVGDKTMIDTLIPAVEAYEDAIKNGLDFHSCFTISLKAAEKGMQSTKNLIARRGRAYYQGEKSIGHLDPGAVSLYFMLEEASNYIQDKK